MSLDVRDTIIIFRDLSDALIELKQKKNSPVDVRRVFGRFITLSQQLTETMRNEYKHLTDKDWNASEFNKWDNVTGLFKKLRRSDYHESLVVINVKESQYYLAEVLEDEEGNEYNDYIIASATWGLGDPFSNEIPKSMGLIGYDENMQPIENIKPEKVEYEFILNPRTDEIRKAIELVGTDDVHILSEKCYKVLEEYFKFYNLCVDKNKRK